MMSALDLGSPCQPSMIHQVMTGAASVPSQPYEW